MARARGLGSVRARTTVVATVVCGVVLVVAVTALAFAVERTLTHRIRAHAQDQVDLVVQRLRAGDTPQDAVQPTRAVDATVPVPVQVEILDEEGHPVFGSGFFTMPGVEGVSTTGLPWEDPVVQVGAVDLAVAQRAIEIDGRLLLVVAASPLAEVVHSVATIIRLSMLGIPLVTLLVGLVTWTATGRTLRPIERLRVDVEELSSRTLDRRVVVPATDDEVARLAATMNGLLGRLEAASARQNAFVSDAAHELRSPVAAIRAELEVTLAHPTSAAWPDVAAGVLEETRRIELLVEDLLILARLDEGAGPASEDVALAPLIREAAGHLTGAQHDARTGAQHGAQHDARTTLDLAEGVIVRGSARELCGVVRNLLDNAARHATDRIHVTTRTAEGDMVVITVEDDGPGIPPDDRQRVFERFTRLEPGRSRTDGGVGLGLAVVDRVVRHHGGTVTVTDAALGGAQFRVTLPRA